STGIGGPSASIALEELANVGVDTFIRVGSAGGRQETIPVGSLVVVTAAHRGEGTSLAYLPPEFPAVADLRVTTALIDAAAALGEQPFVGIATTRDAFHRKDQALAELLSTGGRHPCRGGTHARRPPSNPPPRARVRAGAVLGIDSNIFLPRKEPEEAQRLFREAEARTIGVAIRAVQLLAERDGVQDPPSLRGSAG
ncbi:MAG TPA: nucleoside phosphorylase, partial [bacterium]